MISLRNLCRSICVNFCCSDRFVTQHTLYGAQVGAFKQVGGKGMAEGVGLMFW